MHSREEADVGSELGACWDSNVRGPAQGIADGRSMSLTKAFLKTDITAIAFLNGERLPDPMSLSDTARDLLTEKPKRCDHIPSAASISPSEHQ